MKTWYALSCPVCRFRYPLKKFTAALAPFAYPVQLVTGGGRAQGFHVVEYIPWSTLPRLKENPDLWRALNCEYIRLASAFDSFHTYLGFLSPGMREMIASLNAEIFGLRSNCRELQSQLDRLLLTYPRRSESIGEFGRVLEEISRRDEGDRRSAHDLIR